MFLDKGFYKFHIFEFSKKYDGLIGADLLSYLQATIDFKNLQLITPKVKVPINYEKTLHKNVTKNSEPIEQNFMIEPRTQKIVKIPVNIKEGLGVIEYFKFDKNVEMPKALVNVVNNFAITTILNSNENPIEIKIDQPFDIEPINVFDVNFYEKMDIDEPYDLEYNNLLKSNLQNLRLGHCNKEEQSEIRKLCLEFRDIFYCDKTALTFTNQIKHEIKLTNDSPIYTKSYRYPEVHKSEVKDQIQKMLAQGIIQNSTSPWSSPIWIVPKKLDASGKQKWRMVVDYRKLNEKTIDDKYPLPNITDILDKLGRSQYFTTLDLANGFHQIEMDVNDIPKTAFSTENGHYEFRRMPFGLKNAPASFQRVMDNILRGLQNEICLVYLDDIVIFSTSLQEHITRLRQVFSRLRNSNFKIQIDKSEFLRKEVQYLGHIITPEGVKPNPEKILSVKEFPIPKTAKEIKSFLGLIGYYRRFINNFAKITRPMTLCLKKDAKVIHSPEFIMAFEHCKQLLINAPILTYPDFKKQFILTTDASNQALGAVLSQGNVPNDKPVAYASRTLNETETRYSTIEKELLAIVWACKHFRPYLYGNKFKIYTDHRPLVWLFNLKEPNSKLIRWRLKLEEYDYEIIYKNGKQNTNADALSRIQINALENESTVNNPGDINLETVEFLRDVAQSSNSNLNQPNSKQEIQILQDIQIAPQILEQPNQNYDTNSDTDTAHSYTGDTADSIPIIDEIINNKSNQILIELNPYNKLDVKEENFEHHKILIAKVPKNNEETIFNLLKEYTTNNRTFYIYFYDNKFYKVFNKIYMSKFKKNGLKLIKCTKLVNTIKEIDERLLLIKYQHEGKCNHRGINETLEKLKQNYYWPTMKKDVTKYINECILCQTSKYSRKNPYVPLVLTETVGKPFQLLHADVFRFNDQNFLTIIDAFSKLAQALPIQAKTSLDICNAFLNYFSYYGIPEKITLDNGTEFKNENVKELLKSHKIDIHFTTPSHHESNSPIERFHSTLIEHLRILQQKHPKENIINLMKYGIIAYNNSLHSTTKFSPFELTFGHTNLRDPLDLIETTFYSDYVYNHNEKMKHLYQKTSENLENTKNKILGKRNIHGPVQTQFTVGQTVYKANKKRNKKENKFLGPYEILEILENNKTKVKNKTNNKIEIVHMKELRIPVVTDSSSHSQTRN